MEAQPEIKTRESEPGLVESLLVIGLLALAGVGGWLLYGRFIRLMPEHLMNLFGA